MRLLLGREEQGPHSFGHHHHFGNHALRGEILVTARGFGNGAHDAHHELRLCQFATSDLMGHVDHGVCGAKCLIA